MWPTRPCGDAGGVHFIIQAKPASHHAKFYRAGEWVHPKYQVPAGHDIYNTDIAHITPPDEWLAQVLAI